MRRLGALGLALAFALGAGACSQDPDSIAGQAAEGDQKGYISGDGSIETLEPGDRAEPIELEGQTLEGEPWSLEDTEGDVVVLNVWGSWCPPCVEEAPDLQQVWSDYDEQGAPVQFMGINYRESAATGLAFQEAEGITYPSLADEGGRHLLALQGKASTTPTTLVLDTEGRIAARVAGMVDASTLSGLVDDVLAEQS